MLEEWRPVVGFEGLYEVSDLGGVKSLRTGRILKPATNIKSGYQFVCLHRAGKLPVVCVDLDKFFWGCREAAGFVNASVNQIYYALKKQNKTAGGYRWRRATQDEINRAKEGLQKHK